MIVERWEIWLANLEPVVGSEQGRTRPVLILSATTLNQILPVVNVLPITSRKPNRRIYPNETLIPLNTANLTSESIVLCYQIRTLDRQRLLKRFGNLVDKNLQKQVLDALALIKYAFAAQNSAAVWIAVIIYSLFAVLFGIVFFTHPLKTQN